MYIYYAHPLSIYDTAQEQRDLALLKFLGHTVLNPNSPEADAGYKAKGMAYFEEATVTCEAIFFRAFPDGRLPAGVAKEISYFQKRGLPILELPTGISRRTLSVEATREFLSEDGFR
jgi:hypothetical protein